MPIKTAMIQLEMKQCWTEKQFFDHMENYIKESKEKNARIAIFPEDIGFCLAWVKETKNVRNIRQNITFEQQSIKNLLEYFVDWIFTKIKLYDMGQWLSQIVIERIIKRTFSSLAKKYNMVIVSGSCYVKKFDGLYNVCYVYDNDGQLSGEYEKHKLVPIEISWGVKKGRTKKPIQTSVASIGVVICYDLDEPEFIEEISMQSDLIVAPSGGFRPFPDYPFDPVKERPQIQRAIENNIFILRPYCAGWLFPGLYFQGNSSVVNRRGEVILRAKNKNKGEVIIVDVY